MILTTITPASFMEKLAEISLNDLAWADKGATLKPKAGS